MTDTPPPLFVEQVERILTTAHLNTAALADELWLAAETARKEATPARAKRQRRQRGEGGVFQRADGLWVATIDLGWVNGKRAKKYLYARTQREAVRKLATAKRELAMNGTLASSAPTVEQWMTHWLKEIAPRRNRPSTLAGYRSKVTQYIVPQLGARRLDKLEPQHVRALDAWMQDAGKSPATRLQTYAILSRALTVAHREGKVARNVAALIDPPSLKRPETEPLAPDEIAAVLNAARGTALESRWLTALLLGLRQGEALGLAWRHVDLEAGTLTVERALQRIKGQGLQFVDPKSERSNRTLPLPRLLTLALAARHDAMRPEPDDLVWANPDGTPIDPARDWAAWRDLLAAAGVRHVRLHDARHVAATTLGALGVPDVIVSGILGHAQVRMTHKYQHASLDMMRNAMGMIERAYEPKAIES